MSRSLAWVWLISAGCVYGAPSRGSLAADDECRRVCADAHAGCVRGGVARQLGLPGVTYDLCAREQEGCLERCRPTGGPVTTAAASDGGPVPAGVVWDEAAAKLRCPMQTSWLEVPEAWRASVQVVGEREVRLRAADAVLALQAGPGEPPSPFETWLALHAQLSALGDAPALELKGSLGHAEGMFEYAVMDGGAAGAFRTAQKTVRRAGGYCRAIAVERAGLPLERRATALLEGFH